MQTSLVVLDCPPQAFDEHVFTQATLAVHALEYVVVLEQFDERAAAQLAALVGIEDFRLTLAGNGL